VKAGLSLFVAEYQSVVSVKTISIPDWVIGNFLRLNSGRTMALGSTQPLTEISTRDIFWD